MTSDDRALLALLAATGAVLWWAQIPRGIGWPSVVGTGKDRGGKPDSRPDERRGRRRDPDAKPAPEGRRKGAAPYVDVWGPARRP